MIEKESTSRKEFTIEYIFLTLREAFQPWTFPTITLIISPLPCVFCPYKTYENILYVTASSTTE